MKLILKVSTAASCSLLAVLQTPAAQLDTCPPFTRADYSESSVLAVAHDDVFIGEGSFDLGGINLDVLVTFESDSFHFKYTATNVSGYPLYWAGSQESCGLMHYAATIDACSEQIYPEQTALEPIYGKIKLEDAQKMWMVAGEQRVVHNRIDAAYFKGFSREQISKLRWWSIVPLASKDVKNMHHEYADIYGSWNDRGKFQLDFQPPFWNHTADLPQHYTALANKVMLGKHTEIFGGLQIDSELHYDAGDVVEKIKVTNISGGGLYWPAKIESKQPYASVDFTIDKQRVHSWKGDPEDCVIGIGGGSGGRFGCGHRRSRPNADELDSWFMAPDASKVFEVRNTFDVQQFRDTVFYYSRDAIRGVDRVKGAKHSFHVALNYPPDFFPRSSKWKEKSFEASFSKDEGYSHILCE
ncbi:MAG: hypothetical protein H8E25_16945 [Planctomycetes bacterium]|nr:hypothetical protein [Planctomycetota bacterium]